MVGHLENMMEKKRWMKGLEEKLTLYSQPPACSDRRGSIIVHSREQGRAGNRQDFSALSDHNLIDPGRESSHNPCYSQSPITTGTHLHWVLANDTQAALSLTDRYCLEEKPIQQIRSNEKMAPSRHAVDDHLRLFDLGRLYQRHSDLYHGQTK